MNWKKHNFKICQCIACKSMRGEHPFLGKKRPKHSKKMLGENNPGYNYALNRNCIDCHKKITPTYIRCHSCDTKRKFKLGILNNSGKNNPSYGKIPSIETRKKLSIANRGKNAGAWKGGITPINKIIRCSLKIRIWREKIFKRDNYTCQNCKIRGGKLEAHHIKEFCNYPKLRFRLRNGITLCRNCHKKTNNYMNKAKQGDLE